MESQSGANKGKACRQKGSSGHKQQRDTRAAEWLLANKLEVNRRAMRGYHWRYITPRRRREGKEVEELEERGKEKRIRYRSRRMSNKDRTMW